MKKLYVPVLALLTLASCSKSELANRPVVENDMVEIMATSKALTIETRAPFEGSIASNNTLTAVVLGSTTAADYTTTYCDGEMTFTDDNTTAVGFNTTPKYYPVNDDMVYFCALYPTPATDWKDIAATAKYTFDGKKDVMAAAQQSNNKSGAMKATPDVPSFTFKHLLTKLVVKVKAEDEAAQKVWGNITAISLIKANNGDVFDTAEVTLATGAAATGTAFSNPAADGMAFYRIDAAATPAYTDNAVDATDNKIELTTDAVEAAYSLVAPIIAGNSADHFTLKVSTDLDGTPTVKEVSLKLSTADETPVVFTGDTQGQAFEITLTFKATEIVAKATVTDWVKGGNTEVPIQ